MTTMTTELLTSEMILIIEGLLYMYKWCMPNHQEEHYMNYNYDLYNGIITVTVFILCVLTFEFAAGSDKNQSYSSQRTIVSSKVQDFLRPYVPAHGLSES
jgi:hypothetical protein